MKFKTKIKFFYDLFKFTTSTILKKKELPILINTSLLPNLSFHIDDLRSKYKIVYVDQNVYGHTFSSDISVREPAKKVMELLYRYKINNSFLIVYSTRIIEETSLIEPSESLIDKSRNKDIVQVLNTLAILTHGLLIDEETLTVYFKHPYDVFNQCNSYFSIHKYLGIFSRFIGKANIIYFRNHFKISPKELNNCKTYVDAIKLINKKIAITPKVRHCQRPIINNFDDLINFMVDFPHKFKLGSSNRELDYHLSRAMALEFFGYKAQKDFKFKLGLLADGTHGYISTKVDIFISSDDRLVKSLRFNETLGEKGTEILSPKEFIEKYKDGI